MPDSKFKFLENIATADLAFEAYAKNLPELFENAGLALESAMVDLKNVKDRTEKIIEDEDGSLEDLLFSFLEELVYLKDVEQLVLRRFRCQVGKVGNSWGLICKGGGEKIDPQKHKLGTDVKAITKHMFNIEQKKDRSWHCRVVIDV